MLKNKVILITGGTGFLGRTLTREILKYGPKSIRIFSRDEFKHHKMQEEFDNHPSLRHFIGDVRDYERLKKAMKGCDIVIHAAALKRIDMMEYNVEESIKTNIIGTLNVVRACLENDVEKAVFVSTDKACSPVNTYGACKFVSERIFIESNYSKGDARTCFLCVRYGNVMHSTGSVIPFFVEKLKKNEDVPITDERMTRFLITHKQAVYLIFNALKYGKGGEVFVPKLFSFKIIDLAEYLKEKYNSESKIKFVGIRPGEKLHELMIDKPEVRRSYVLGDMFIILSEIEKYSKTKEYKHKYKYVKKCKKVDFETYSSETALVEGEELKNYLDRLDL